MTHGAPPINGSEPDGAAERSRSSPTPGPTAALSIDHVTVMSRAVANPRVTNHIIGLQELLIERAQEIPFEMWRNEVLGIVETLDADGSFRPDQPDTPSILHLLPLFDGTTQLHAHLSPADSAIVDKALNDEADLLFRRYTRDHDESGGATRIPPRAQLMAEALVSLCRKGAAIDLDSTAPARTEAVIVINADSPDTATINNNNNVPIPNRHFLGLLSDANWRRIVLDANGDVLDLGRTRRLANPAQRRALDIRDGGCVFPGCDSPPSWCDAHHLTRWDDNGNTDLRNLVLLCRHHHGVIHRLNWTWALDPTNGRVRWTTPGGVELISQRHRQPPGRRPPDTRPVASRQGRGGISSKDGSRPSDFATNSSIMSPGWNMPLCQVAM